MGQRVERTPDRHIDPAPHRRMRRVSRIITMTASIGRCNVQWTTVTAQGATEYRASRPYTYTLDEMIIIDAGDYVSALRAARRGWHAATAVSVSVAALDRSAARLGRRLTRHRLRSVAAPPPTLLARCSATG